jgi:site-specific recombinase XerC
MDKKETLDKFINLLAVNKGFRIRTLQEYKVQLKIALQLIEKLKNEYQLD